MIKNDETKRTALAAGLDGGKRKPCAERKRCAGVKTKEEIRGGGQRREEEEAGERGKMAARQMCASICADVSWLSHL